MNNKSLRKLTSMAMLAAVSVILVSLVHFPLIPAVSFLEYDPADIPILICGFAFGPVAGICVTIVASLIQGLTVSASSGIYGIIMHIIATSALVLTASIIYKKNKTRKGALVAIICGIIAMTLIMIPANLFITPAFMGAPRAAVVQMLGAIILFNFLKAGINGFVTFIIYKKISALIHKFDKD